MKALSLWQPWASLWLTDRKIHETRSWCMRLPIGGLWLAVHAAKRIELSVAHELHSIVEDEFGGHWAMDLPRGAIIGAVHVTCCYPTQSIRQSMEGRNPLPDDFYCGNFEDGRFGFRRDLIRTLKTPIPFRGRQGLFDVPDDLFREAA